MAAEYQVRMDGKVHGPFTAKQLKKLADGGRITEDAEIRQGDDGAWYPATKVKGLFDNKPSEESVVVDAAPEKPAESERSSTSSKRTSRKNTASKSSSSSKSTKSKRAAKKKANVVDAEAVFDLDDDDDDVEFLDDDEDDLFDDEDDFDDDDEDDFFEDDDDFRPRSRSRGPSRSRGRSRSRGGTSWGQVRVGLLLLGIAVCIWTAAFGMQALSELIGGMMLGSGKFPGQGTAKLLEMLFKGAIFVTLLANVTAIVGGSMSVFAPGDKGAKGMAIAVLATIGVHLVTHFIYVFQPVFDRSPFGPSFGFGGGFGGFGGGDIEVQFALTWIPYYAGLILTSLLVWALAEYKKDYREAGAAANNIWLIGIYVGLMMLAYMAVKLELFNGMGGGRAMYWLMFLVRMGHLSLLGVFLGRLIPQVFYIRGRV